MVKEYAPGTNGNAAPTALIAGPNTGLSEPFGVAEAPAGVVVQTPTGAVGGVLFAVVVGVAFLGYQGWRRRRPRTAGLPS